MPPAWPWGIGLDAMWRRISEMEDWSVPQLQRLRDSVLELFQHTGCADPDTPEHTRNHLTDHSAIDRDGNLIGMVNCDGESSLSSPDSKQVMSPCGSDSV